MPPPLAASVAAATGGNPNIITVSFPYAITHHSSSGSSSAAEALPQIQRKVQALCDIAAGETGCAISYSGPEPNVRRDRDEGPAEVLLSVTVMGTTAAVGRARGIMLRNMPTQAMLTIKAPLPLLLSTSGEMQPHVRKRLDLIMTATRTEITCVGQNEDSSPRGKHAVPPGMPPDDEDKPWESMDVEIVGRNEDVEMGKMDVLIFFDELSLQAGLHIEPMAIPPNLQAVLAGRKRGILETVMHETQTNIYVPTPFLAETCRPENLQQVVAYARTVWVAGTPQGVRLAVERMSFMAQQRAALLQTRSISALPRKLDWLLLNRKPQLQAIMSDNATHITIPALGSTQNTVQIAGDDRVYLDRTCRALMHMICGFYVAGIQLASNPIPPGAKSSHPLVIALSQVPLQTSCELLLSPPYIELYGLNPFVKEAFMGLTRHPTLLPMVRDTKFQLELALEHRDFINGKKNGKINKITKTSGCRVTFQEHFNDWNMLIDLYNATPGRCVEGLGMLEDELPAEISFHVPEAYHKRIIGVGGKNIQRIMKKWAVYVKFSNAEEFAQLGGYFANMDNVIARTPAKNAESLAMAKESIVELTGVDAAQEHTTLVVIPRQMHRLVVGPRAVYLNDLVKTTGVLVKFPKKDSGQDAVVMTGSEQGIAAARNRLLELVPAVHFYAVPGGPKAWHAVTCPDVGILVLRLLQEVGLDMYVHHAPPGESEQEAPQCTFMLYYHRQHTPPATLEVARGMIAEYLTGHGVSVPVPEPPTPGGTIPPRPGMGSRSGSYANLQPNGNYDSFQHFHSKLVVGGASKAESRESLAFHSGSYGNVNTSPTVTTTVTPHQHGMSSTNFSQSTPNLRQLFEDGQVTVPLTGGEKVLTTTRSTSELKRSKSGALPDGGSSASGNPDNRKWPTHFARHLGPSMSIDTSSDDGGSEGEESDGGLQDPAKDAELLKGFAGMLSPIDAPGMNHGPPSPLPPVRAVSNLVPEGSASDPPASFTSEVIEELFAAERADPKSMAQTRALLAALDLEGTVDLFVEQEVDLPTLLLLGDADLRELGVRAFGTRKRILGAMRKCKEWKALHQPPGPALTSAGGDNPGSGGAGELLRGGTHSARSSTINLAGGAGFGPSAIMQRSSVGSRPQGQMQQPQGAQQYQQQQSSRNGFGHYMYASTPSPTSQSDGSSPTPIQFGTLPLGTLQSGSAHSLHGHDSGATSPHEGGGGGAAALVVQGGGGGQTKRGGGSNKVHPAVAVSTGGGGGNAGGGGVADAGRPRAAPNSVDQAFFAKFDYL
ncbi:hypothetical protein HKX48_003779 [Thoreauomyces humboldtii]|nr:hypothetical protein HKX48_003779 [Thoreauomyces humboldtii]